MILRRKVLDVVVVVVVVGGSLGALIFRNNTQCATKQHKHIHI